MNVLNLVTLVDTQVTENDGLHSGQQIEVVLGLPFIKVTFKTMHLDMIIKRECSVSEEIMILILRRKKKIK